MFGEFYYFFYNIRVERIREVKGEKLVAAGIRWRQDRALRPFFGSLIIAVVVMAASAAGAAMARVPVSENKALWLAPVVCGLLALFSTLLWWTGLVYKRREITFAIDGTIHTPKGFPGFPFRKKIDGSYKNFASIEVGHPAGRGGGYHVAGYSRGGSTVWFAEDLSRPQAHEIATQLNLALEDMRDAERGGHFKAEPPPDYDPWQDPDYDPWGEGAPSAR